MGYPTKIVTCCYCGTRAALVLKGRERHELACSACGAPLHDLKMLPKKIKDKPKRYAEVPQDRYGPDKRKPRKRKKRKSLFKKAVSEIFDVVEDIFD